jgi:PKD repeat protein
LSWAWDFGDGTLANEQNPVHTYETPGNYLVSLTIENPVCTNTAFARTIFVSYVSACDADFSFSQINTTVPVVEFQNQSSGLFDNVLWDFGDGTTSWESSPVHTFPSFGLYDVRLVIDGDICHDSVTKQVEVVGTSSCEAAFSITQEFPQCRTITFINESSGNDFSSSWDFGDETTSEETNPVHEYAANGEYQVSLVIHTADDCYDTAWQTLEILPPLTLSGNIWAGVSPLTFGNALLYFFNTQGELTLFDQYELTDGTFLFTDLSPGDYFIEAVPDFQFPYPVIPKYFPTYSGNALKWNGAQVFNTGNLPDNISVYLQSFDDFFDGEATVAGKIIARGDFTDIPLVMFLYGETGDPLDFRIVDQQNNFSFENIPYGKYQLYPEKAGKSGQPMFVNLSDDKPEIHDVVFLESALAITPDLTSVGEMQETSVLLSPNPADDHLLIITNGLNGNSFESHVRIFDMMQQIVMEFSFTGNTDIINVSSMRQGMYLMQLTTGNDHFRKKIIIEH